MKLNLEQIKKITLGACHIEETDSTFHFHRFTKEQEDLYKNTHPDLSCKTFATAGVKLSFKTDSKSLFISFSANTGSSRKYFSFDFYANKNCIGHLDNFEGVTLSENYTTTELPMGEFSKTFSLGDGEKEVVVHFPWSINAIIKEISLDDGSFIEEVRPVKKMLIFGDSITQGYDALRPSIHHTSRLCESLNVEGFNKAIGGEIFFPELAKLKDTINPNYITVAYGTNDWSHCDRDTFNKNCKEFYQALSKNYPSAKIFAITPIWRKDYKDYRPFGSFLYIQKDIEKAIENIENITLISGFDFVPEDEKYFADLYLHPNDDGFDYYYNNLYQKLKSLL